MKYNEFKSGMIGKKLVIKAFSNENDTLQLTSVGVLAVYNVTPNLWGWSFNHQPDMGSINPNSYRLEIEIYNA